MKAVIVPNDEMQPLHYFRCCACARARNLTLSYLPPKLHEEDMERPLEDAPMERKRPEQPALASFPVRRCRRRLKNPSPLPNLSLQPPRLKPQRRPPLNRASWAACSGGLKNLFAGEEQPAVEEAKPAETPKAEGNGENRHQDRRGQRRQGTGRKERGERSDRGDRPERGERKERGEGRDNRERDNREPREDREGRESRESRDEQRRQPPQPAAERAGREETASKKVLKRRAKINSNAVSSVLNASVVVRKEKRQAPAGSESAGKR